MTPAWVNQIRRIAAEVVGRVPQPRWGIVESVDPSRPAVKVSFQPEGVTSGWLPVLGASAGAGASGMAIPVQGSMAYVVPEAGDDGSGGAVVGFAHNDGAPFPSVPNTNGTGGTPSSSNVAGASGEWVIVAFGSVIRLAANGDIYLKPGSTNVLIDGNLKVNGDISDQHGKLDRLRGNYNAHTHPANNTTTSRVDPE